MLKLHGQAHMGRPAAVRTTSSPVSASRVPSRLPSLCVCCCSSHSHGNGRHHHHHEGPSSSSSSHGPASLHVDALNSAFNSPAVHRQEPPAAAAAAASRKYKRIMLKVSGEALQGEQGHGIDPKMLDKIAEEIKAAHAQKVQIAVVVGGGNYFRGASAGDGLERATADYVGMLATVMNALCLQGALEKKGVPTRVQTAIEMREVAEPYIRRRAIRHLAQGSVVIFGAGTGNPYFTTDTAAALRAAEVNADVFLKATKVDGVYDQDPVKYPATARRYDKLSYRQVATDELRVMDATAITLCKENNIPVIVFNVFEEGNILKAAMGEAVGTVVAEFDDSLPPAAVAAPSST